MDTALFIFALSALTGSVYLLIGFLLSYKQKIEIINGVDFSQLKNVAGFCKYIGNSMILSGAVLIFLGWLVYTQSINLIVFVILFIGFCVLPSFHFVKAKRKFS